MGAAYNKLRLNLFIRSYCGKSIKGRLQNTYKENRDFTSEVFKLARVLRLSQHLLKPVLLRDHNPRNFLLSKMVSKEDREKISIYLEIENEMFNLRLEKLNKDSLISEDYEQALLSVGVERVAGNHLTSIEDDNEFEVKLIEIKKQYINWYYKVAYKYKLPTLRILPFIWRLINF